jgi:hypothetical protein
MHYLFKTLFYMFIAGLLGSALVILFTFIDDAIATFTHDSPTDPTPEAAVTDRVSPV